MNNTLILLVLLIFNFQNYGLTKKPWTFMTYIAGDNSLAGYVNDDINEMQKGANDNVNVLVYSNVRENRKKLAKKIVVTKDAISVVGTEENLDSGAASTLLKALTWTITEAPSDYLAVGLWDHGSGMLNPNYRTRGICFDDSTGSYLNDKDIKSDLDTIVKQRGKKIDILFFDACLMANIECMATWADNANFMVASEQTIPGEGYNYQFALSYLNKMPYPGVFAIDIVEAYKTNYQNMENDYTLSAISLEKVKNLAKNVNLVARYLINLIKNDNSLKKVIKESRNNTINFQEPSYIDLGHFYSNLLSNLTRYKMAKKEKLLNQLRSLLEKGLLLIKQTVINNVAGPYYSKATGISIYFPIRNIDSSYQKLYWTEQYPQWNELIKRVLK